MKRAFILSVCSALMIPAIPVSIKAQQVYVYQVCKTYQESYNPGYYDQYGNYVRGSVNTNVYNSQCGGNGGYRNAAPVQQVQQRPCAAATIGSAAGGYAAYRRTGRVADRWWSIPLGVGLGNMLGNSLCNS